ncbi:filamentous hemagglutinin-like protein [Anabaenopsis circularis NIES-21]|uniref:Filamentous hemagglutinin-like protein n=1 Tax=Anabaenopsis circularis NIES-21 TaxID=1085406 RepID=A0A1Z4GAR1_9CYAN|nr:filamentous hemagglutinin-like protein [Anabaenopsis circularis NIES-21]
MSNLHWWSKILGSAIGSVIAFSANSTSAQIMQDGTLPTNSQVTTQNNTTIITGGTRVGDNLFHSFLNFSVPANTTASFQNTAGIQNIISRVTGNSISEIDGTLQAGGTANLFLINPNGIVFGPQATLNIGGSFLASTASRINFADGKTFSATDTQVSSLLSVSIPIGLQFTAIAAPIRNLSQASPNGAINVIRQPVGLQVQSGKTLALVGGDLFLDGGNVTAKSGNIELGSVVPNSLVTLKPISQGWVLGYESVNNFQNIRLAQRIVGSTAVGSVLDASGVDGGGRITVQGNIVELISRYAIVTSQTLGMRDGQDLTINAKNLILRDGAQIRVSTFNKGDGGNLNVNASDSVELIGGIFEPVMNRSIATALVSDTVGDGHAGDITVNTSRLRLKNGAAISAGSSGNLNSSTSTFIPARGNGGNITINASDSVEITGILAVGFPSNLSARTRGPGAAGTVTVNTAKLLIRDGGIAVASQIPRLPPNTKYQGNVNELGTAGEINVNAGSILLDKKGQISSNSQGGGGGDITLQVQDVLLLRRNSQISTNAGTGNAPGNGGNITINAPNGFIVATPQGNNDITANAFSGAGGRIFINANSIFGFVQRSRADLVQLLGTEDSRQLNPNRLPTSDITAFSQQNPSLNGTIQINTPDVDPSRGLLELPAEPVDASRQIAADCKPGSKLKKGSLIATGRGGIVPSPTEPFMDDSVLVNWITLNSERENSTSYLSHHVSTSTQKLDSANQETQIIPAQGWVRDDKGNVTLVAQAPTVTPHSPLLNRASCAAHL